MSKFFSLIKIKKERCSAGGRKIVTKVSRNYPLLTGLFLILTAFFGVFYIIKINQSLSYGMKLNSIKKEISNLSRENDNLESVILKVQSIQNVQAESLKLKMVQVGDIKYLSDNQSGVAFNK